VCLLRGEGDIQTEPKQSNQQSNKKKRGKQPQEQGKTRQRQATRYQKPKKQANKVAQGG
jgi:hypothetical protein